MPNWCEGTLKIRGTIDKVKEVLEYMVEDKKFFKIEIENDNQLSVYFDDDYTYIKGTRRAFFTKQCDEFIFKDRETEGIVELNFQQAWRIEATQFSSISDKLKVDLKLFGFERNMLFTQEIEVHNGIIYVDVTRGYRDHKRYEWEVPFSKLGG